MRNLDYAGYWTGTISGTNQGGLALEMKQLNGNVTGIAAIREPSLGDDGQYQYLLSGRVADPLILQMEPEQRFARSGLGTVEVTCRLVADDQLKGTWKSSVDTSGGFLAERFSKEKMDADLPTQNSVFIVHGLKDSVKQSVARFLEKLGIEPVILHEQINAGQTIIEKFEKYASRAGFAIVLMTGDDYGYPKGDVSQKRLRARQNVVLELGYFVAQIGRKNIMVLLENGVEFPSDIYGVVYEPLDPGGAWKVRLARELRAAGYQLDLNQGF